MVDSVAVLPWAMPILDANGDPVAGGSIEFYDAGTTDARTVYSTSDLSTTSLGTTVSLNSAGIPVNGSNTPILIYTGSTDYKVIIKTSADVTLYTFDNIKGAIDTSSFGTGSGTFSSEIDASAGDITLVAGDAGKLKNLDCSGGDITATLESAVTVGDGHIVGIRHNGSANEIRIATVSGQTIQLPGSTTSAGFALTGKGHTVWLVSDGAGYVVAWEIPPLISPDSGIIKIADRLLAPPISPEPGERIIIGPTGTPTGDFAGKALGTIAESDGQGGWIYHTPPTNCGWLAYIQDEQLYTSFQGSAWVDQSGMGAAQSSTLKTAIFTYETSNGASGGTTTSNTDTRYPLNTVVNGSDDNFITGATLTSEVISGLPAGTYRFKFDGGFGNAGHTQIGIKNVTTGTTYWGVLSHLDVAGSPGDVKSTFERDLVVAADTDQFEVRFIVSSGTSGQGLGTASTFSNGNEIHGQLVIEDLSSLRGAEGPQGPQGPSFVENRLINGDFRINQRLRDDATITNITQANPGVVTTSANHNFTIGDTVLLSGVVGMTEVNGNTYTVANSTFDGDTFELSGTDTSGFTAYTSGGTAAKVYPDDTYCSDRWYALTQTSYIDVDALTDIEDGWPFGLRLTQLQASAQRMGIAQIVESRDGKDLRGQSVALAGRVKCSVAATLRFAILEWTGTADSVTSDVVNDWTSSTYTASNFFLGSNLTVTAVGSLALSAGVAADFELTGTVGSSMNNMIVLVWTEGTLAQNATLDIGECRLIGGASAGGFIPPDTVTEKLRCQRFYEELTGEVGQRRIRRGPGTATGNHLISVQWFVQKRATPTMTRKAVVLNDTSTVTFFGPDTQEFEFFHSITVSGGFTYFGYTADAEL